jgi:hypothetical protein
LNHAKSTPIAKDAIARLGAGGFGGRRGVWPRHGTAVLAQHVAFQTQSTTCGAQSGSLAGVSGKETKSSSGDWQRIAVDAASKEGRDFSNGQPSFGFFLLFLASDQPSHFISLSTLCSTGVYFDADATGP